MSIIFRMNASTFIDRCGLRLLVLIACFAIVNTAVRYAPLRVFAASAAAVAAAGALDALLPRPPAPVTARSFSLKSFLRSALTRSNAKRFIVAALILSVAAFFLPFRVPYIVAACVLTAVAVVCLASRN